MMISPVVSDRAAKMPPLWNQRDAAGEDVVPVEVARLQLRGRFVGAVVEHHWGAHALAAVAIHRGHVGAVHAVVLEALVEGLHAHGQHALGDQVADGVIRPWPSRSPVFRPKQFDRLAAQLNSPPLT